jgi:wobble nucleotide-excising tRNase
MSVERELIARKAVKNFGPEITELNFKLLNEDIGSQEFHDELARIYRKASMMLTPQERVFIQTESVLRYEEHDEEWHA